MKGTHALLVVVGIIIAHTAGIIATETGSMLMLFLLLIQLFRMMVEGLMSLFGSKTKEVHHHHYYVYNELGGHFDEVAENPHDY